MAMSEILQANVFFIITSIAVVLMTIFACFILYQIIMVLRSVRKIVERIEEGSDVIAEDVAQLRAYVMEGSLVSQIMGFFLGRTSRVRRSAKSKTTDLTSK